MSRKIDLLTPLNSESEETPNPERTGTGAVRLFGRSLDKLAREVADADELRSQLAGGTQVIELETAIIERAPVADRLTQTEDDAFRALVKSMQDHGQQVPILVRPHPKNPERYQVAYGHRRLAAATELGRKVRAVIRTMTDTELVIAQGKENTERRDLSFIERALFARNLEDAGFDRGTIIAALSVDKAEATRLLGVARSIPGELIHAIGPAPKAGRPRWMELSELLKGRGAIVKRVLAEPGFLQADTDARFSKLFAALSSPNTKGKVSAWLDPQGRPVVMIERGTTKTQLTVDEKLAPQFGAYLEDNLNELYSAFSRRQNEERG
ncbi:MAG TPA: plasmid partitioning protein RepB [Chthoniobacterales bacterium]|nr:plasmid partitioning protein RepB [Chthoniobacterales bacterium]